MRNKKIVAITLIAMVMILTIANLAYALTGYSYYTTISIQNTDTSSFTGRVIFDWNPASLISGGYMQADGSDSALDYTGTEIDLTAKDLAHDAAEWMTDIITIPAGGAKNYTLWNGNPAPVKDGVWCGDDGDTNTVTDNASLDITDDLTVSSDVYLDDLPVAETYFVEKQGNYALLVDNTDFIFRVYQAGAPTTEDLSPDGAGDVTQLTPVGAANNWDCVDDPPPLNAAPDGDRVSSTTTALYDLYSLADTAIPNGSTITTVTIYYTGLHSVGAGANRTIQPVLKLGGTELYGTQQNLTNIFTQYNEALARPGGGSWVVSDLDDLQAGIKLDAGGVGGANCYQLYVEIAYTPVVATDVTIAAATDAWINVEGHYDTTDAGAELRIRKDGGAWTTQALGGALNTSADDLHIGEIVAKIDDTIIDDNGTEVLNLTYEPDEIDDVDIFDNSASSNDVAYSLAANPGTITVTVGTMYPVDTSLSLTTSGISSDAAGIINQPSDFHQSEQDLSGTNVSGDIPNTIVTALSEASGGSLDNQWIWWFGYMLIAISIAVAVAKTSRNYFIMWMAYIVVTALFVAYGPIPWWFLMFYVMGALFTIIQERSPQV